MTKMQLRFGLQHPVDDQMAERIVRLNSVYGIEHVRVAPTLDKIMVEYDATRLSGVEVETLLNKFSIPVVLEA